MVEGRVPQSSGQERFQVPCMAEGRVPQSRGQAGSLYTEGSLLDCSKFFSLFFVFFSLFFFFFLFFTKILSSYIISRV